MDASGAEGLGHGRRDIVVVPHALGPLVSLDDEPSHDRDDLDELIDELLPDVDARPGWFDAGLIAVGAGLLAWAIVGNPPTIVLVLGIISVAIGGILPIRTAWRRSRQRLRQHRRDALLAKGVPMDVSSPTTRRLARAYNTLVALGDDRDVDTPAMGAAHGAVLEAASLLNGRAPTSEREHEYVEKRAIAVEVLVAALREAAPADSTPGLDVPVLDSDAVIAAREELDQLTGFNAVSRLDELAQELKHRRHDRD